MPIDKVVLEALDKISIAAKKQRCSYRCADRI